MKKENASAKKLEVGKDYVHANDLNTTVIDRCGDYPNKGFYGARYQSNFSCYYIPKTWRAATKEEVVEAFKKHLIYRYGRDWMEMKIKEKHPDSTLEINDGLWEMEISKEYDGWNVWNKNGLLYCKGIWVERLEEEPKIHIKDAIKKNTVIHCETEEEAERILKMANELGYRWYDGDKFTYTNEWNVYGNKTCYDIKGGVHGRYQLYRADEYTIIHSTQIANLEEGKKSTIQDAIKEKTVIHCETIGEADRILKMAIELGYTWNNGRSYKGDYKWGVNESATFYNILKGLYGSVWYTNNTIIPSTQIADLEEEKYCNCPIPAQLPGGLLCFKCQQFIRKEQKPLFITEDGIKITENRTAIILVDADFMKQYKPAIDCDINTVIATTKLFFHESNADEYIWKNKPVFSYEEIAKRANQTELYYLKTLAKERIKK